MLIYLRLKKIQRKGLWWKSFIWDMISWNISKGMGMWDSKSRKIWAAFTSRLPLQPLRPHILLSCVQSIPLRISYSTSPIRHWLKDDIGNVNSCHFCPALCVARIGIGGQRKALGGKWEMLAEKGLQCIQEHLVSRGCEWDLPVLQLSPPSFPAWFLLLWFLALYLHTYNTYFVDLPLRGMDFYLFCFTATSLVPNISLIHGQ